MSCDGSRIYSIRRTRSYRRASDALIMDEQSNRTPNEGTRLILMGMSVIADAVVVLGLLGLWSNHRLLVTLLGIGVELLILVVAIGLRINRNNPFFGSASALSLGFIAIAVYMWFLSLTSISTLDFSTRRNPIVGTLAIAPALYFTYLGLICLYAIFIGRPSPRFSTGRLFARLYEPVFRVQKPRDR